jgi:hypothetical protein
MLPVFRGPTDPYTVDKGCQMHAFPPKLNLCKQPLGPADPASDFHTESPASPPALSLGQTLVVSCLVHSSAWSFQASLCTVDTTTGSDASRAPILLTMSPALPIKRSSTLTSPLLAILARPDPIWGPASTLLNHSLPRTQIPTKLTTQRRPRQRLPIRLPKPTAAPLSHSHPPTSMLSITMPGAYPSRSLQAAEVLRNSLQHISTDVKTNPPLTLPLAVPAASLLLAGDHYLSPSPKNLKFGHPSYNYEFRFHLLCSSSRPRGLYLLSLYD